jgi:glycosyltransferase involved in cell wall biosynthesis
VPARRLRLDHPASVVVVDDASDDSSLEVIEKFPCKLVRLEVGGVSGAQRGAMASAGSCSSS